MADRGRMPDLKGELGQALSIPIAGLPDELTAKLMKLATFPNPLFYEKQRLRFPVFKIPRYIVSFEKSETMLTLPRGTLEEAQELFESRGSRLEITDLRLSEKRIRIRFSGKLTPPQQRAVDSFDAKDWGVVVAPPGFGKTVVACAMIARWKLATVILVNRRTIAAQWRDRLSQFTTLAQQRVGFWGGGKANLSGVVDVVMMQSLARRENVGSFFRDYSAVFIDECHHVPAVTFETLMKRCGCRKIVGLTATPHRKDRLEKLLFQQCGPVRYIGGNDADPDLRRRIHVVKTGFNVQSDERGDPPLHEIWEILIADASRNRLIIGFLASQLQEGRRCLVLSDRRAHLNTLTAMAGEALSKQSVLLETMVGGQGEKALAQQEARLRDGLKSDVAVCVFATGSFLGEGYDRREFDTLFLCMPVSFKGRVIQYAGRLHRRCEGKREARVFDFLDERLPVGMSMWRRRKRAYAEMGYEGLDAVDSPI